MSTDTGQKALGNLPSPTGIDKRYDPEYPTTTTEFDPYTRPYFVMKAKLSKLLQNKEVDGEVHLTAAQRMAMVGTGHKKSEPVKREVSIDKKKKKVNTFQFDDLDIKDPKNKKDLERYIDEVMDEDGIHEKISRVTDPFLRMILGQRSKMQQRIDSLEVELKRYTDDLVGTNVPIQSQEKKVDIAEYFRMEKKIDIQEKKIADLEKRLQLKEREEHNWRKSSQRRDQLLKILHDQYSLEVVQLREQVYKQEVAQNGPFEARLITCIPPEIMRQVEAIFLAELQGEGDGNDMDYGAMKKRLADLERALKEGKDALFKKAEALGRADAKIHQLQAAVKALEEECGAVKTIMQERIDFAQKKLREKYEAEMEELRKENQKALEATEAKCQQIMDGMKKEVERANSRSEGLAKKLEAKADELTEAMGEKQKIEAQLSKKNEDLSNMRKKFNESETRFMNDRAEAKALKDKMELLENKIESLEKGIEERDEIIRGLKEKMKQNEALVKAAEKKIAEAEARAKLAEQQLETLRKRGRLGKEEENPLKEFKRREGEVEEHEPDDFAELMRRKTEDDKAVNAALDDFQYGPGRLGLRDPPKIHKPGDDVLKMAGVDGEEGRKKFENNSNYESDTLHELRSDNNMVDSEELANRIENFSKGGAPPRSPDGVNKFSQMANRSPQSTIKTSIDITGGSMLTGDSAIKRTTVHSPQTMEESKSVHPSPSSQDHKPIVVPSPKREGVPGNKGSKQSTEKAMISRFHNVLTGNDVDDTDEDDNASEGESSEGAEVERYSSSSDGATDLEARLRVEIAREYEKAMEEKLKKMRQEYYDRQEEMYSHGYDEVEQLTLKLRATEKMVETMAIRAYKNNDGDDKSEHPPRENSIVESTEVFAPFQMQILKDREEKIRNEMKEFHQKALDAERKSYERMLRMERAQLNETIDSAQHKHEKEREAERAIWREQIEEEKRKTENAKAGDSEKVKQIYTEKLNKSEAKITSLENKLHRLEEAHDEMKEKFAKMLRRRSRESIVRSSSKAGFSDGGDSGRRSVERGGRADAERVHGTPEPSTVTLGAQGPCPIDVTPSVASIGPPVPTPVPELSEFLPVDLEKESGEVRRMHVDERIGNRAERQFEKTEYKLEVMARERAKNISHLYLADKEPRTTGLKGKPERPRTGFSYRGQSPRTARPHTSHSHSTTKLHVKEVPTNEACVPNPPVVQHGTLTTGQVPRPYVPPLFRKDSKPPQPMHDVKDYAGAVEAAVTTPILEMSEAQKKQYSMANPMVVPAPANGVPPPSLQTPGRAATERKTRRKPFKPLRSYAPQTARAHIAGLASRQRASTPGSVGPFSAQDSDHDTEARENNTVAGNLQSSQRKSSFDDYDRELMLKGPI